MTESFNTWNNGAPIITVGTTSDFSWWHNGAPVLQLGALPAGSIAGTAAMVFGTSGTLTATASLEGTAAMAFTASATITDAGSEPPSPIGGTSAMTFGTSATITATGSISGQSGMVFGGDASIIGLQTVSIGGKAAMVFGVICDLGAVSLGPGGGNAISEWRRAGPMNVRIPWLDTGAHPWKYRRISPKRARVYHIPY